MVPLPLAPEVVSVPPGLVEPELVMPELPIVPELVVPLMPLEVVPEDELPLWMLPLTGAVLMFMSPLPVPVELQAARLIAINAPIIMPW